MGGFNDIWDEIKKPFNWLANGANDAAKWSEQAVVDAADWSSQAGKDAGNGFNDVAKVLDGTALSAWQATSDGANVISSAASDAGIAIGSGFIAGATTIGEVLEEGAVQTGKGLVALETYVSEHLCDIAVGSALAAVFAALAADGEEEAGTASLASICATQTIDNVALKTGSMALAFIIVEPVYSIPGVSSALGGKSNAKSLIAFLIFKVCKEKPKVVVCTGGQYIVATLLFGLTAAICEGKVPLGFTDFDIWDGAQNA